MENDNILHIAIIGIGNSLRSDDGIGLAICARLEQLSIPGLTIQTCQQLNIEIIEELLPYNHILVVDASTTGEDVALFQVQQDDSKAFCTSHQLNTSMLKALAFKVYGKTLSIYICAVRGTNFEIGDQLSNVAITNMNHAISKIINWIELSNQT